MGGGIFKCCKEAAGFEEIDSDGEEDPYARDIIILRNMMNGAPSIFLAVTISYPDGKVRAVVPESQSLDSTCIKDIVNFFKGKTGGLAERYVNLGPGLPRYIPGKMIDNSVLFCSGLSEKRSEGCVVLKTRTCLLIVCYNGDSEMSVRMAQETVHRMMDCDL